MKLDEIFFDLADTSKTCFALEPFGTFYATSHVTVYIME